MVRTRLIAALAMGVLVLAGCGDSSPTPAAQLEVWSPAVQANGMVSPGVYCGGGTLWLPMKWEKIPAKTEELVLYFGRFAKADPRRPSAMKIPFGSVFPKVDLDARGTAANAFPPGAEPIYYRLTNCVSKATGQKYLGAILALDSPVFVPDPMSESFARRITEEALGFKNPSTKSKAAEELLDNTLAMGSFTATYGKPQQQGAG